MAAETARVVIGENGVARFVYTDALAPLLAEGTAEVCRVSHVEPHPEGGWTADMSPAGGPVLVGPDGKPFALRATALAAELAWLREHEGL